MAGSDAWRTGCRVLLAAFYGVAGILHIAIPEPFLTITPGWVPQAETVILLTGLCEIAGAIGLLVPSLRKYASIALALYAVCVFPANIKHAIDSLGAASVSPLQWLYHIPRLLLQPVIVWATLIAGGLLTWPLQRMK